MTTSRIDELVAGLTGVRDDRGAGPSTPGARALLTAITAEAAPAEAAPSASPIRRRPYRRYGRLVVGAVAATAVATTTVVALNAGGPAPVRNYANAAVDIQRTEGTYQVHVKNIYADQRQFHEAFAKFGLDVTLSIVPVAPGREHKVVRVGTDGGRVGMTLARTPGPDGAYPLTVELSGKELGTGPSRITIGRTARPGEVYQLQLPGAGDRPPSLRLTGRTVAGALARLHRRKMTAVYRIGEFHKGGSGNVYSPPPTWRPGADRQVTGAWLNSSDSVALLIAPGGNDPAPDPNAPS
ncbi:MAG: hypothetical protein ACRDP6_45375 [Actinoallomurus sp.]